jgi:hypothetical protein
MEAFKIVHKNRAEVLVVFADAGAVRLDNDRDPKKYYLAKEQSSNKIFLLSAEEIAQNYLFMNFFDIHGDIK